jgi:hypothetical protein
MGHIVTKLWVQLSHQNGVVAVVIKTFHNPTLTGASFASTSDV